MAKIEVGMLVEIVQGKVTAGPNKGKDQSHFIGHVGKVLRPCNTYLDCWIIEGAETTTMGTTVSFQSKCLRPIKDDDQASWEEIQKATGWHPERVEA